MNHPPQTALVLGAIKGIGKAIAVYLARQGHQVVATWYDWEESLPALEADLAEVGSPHSIIKCDLRDPQAVLLLLKSILTRFGSLDIVINNIERGGWPVVHGAYTREQWDLEFATTVRAKRWVFEAALPHLKASGNGVVLNISSIAGLVGRRGPAGLVFNDGYAAANRCIGSLTETWAIMGAPEVRVNEIMLGFFPTRHGPQTRGWPLLSTEQQQALIEHTLLKRLGDMSDIISAVKFLIWEAPYITGTILRLDGGYVLGGQEVPPMPAGVL